MNVNFEYDCFYAGDYEEGLEVLRLFEAQIMETLGPVCRLISAEIYPSYTENYRFDYDLYKEVKHCKLTLIFRLKQTSFQDFLSFHLILNGYYSLFKNYDFTIDFNYSIVRDY